MIRKFWCCQLQFFFLSLLICGSTPSAAKEKPDSLNDEIKKEYHPKTKTQVELLLILQKARLEKKGNPDLSIKLNQEFFDKSVKAGEPFYAANALYQISRVYMDRHLYFQAMDYSLRAYQILADNHLEMKSTYFMIGIGNCYFQSGNFMIAEGYFRKAELLFKSANDIHGIAVAENNIGLVKQKLNQKDSALWYFQKALEQRKKLRQIANIGHSFYYIGSAWAGLGNLTNARNYFELAIPLLRVSSDNPFLRHDYNTTMADVYFELGKLCEIQNEHKEALINYNKAIGICDTIYERVKMPDIYIAIGHTYINTHDFRQALDSYRKALRITDSANLLNMKKTCYENMIQVFLKDRQDDSVSAYLRRLSQVTDTIQAQMVDSRFNEIRLALRIKETETETKAIKAKNTLTISFFVTIGILLLIIILISVIYIRVQKKTAKISETEIKARKKAEKELEKLYKELKEINAGKDRFISILSHDLRSPFNAMMGFADLLVEETADKNIPEIRHYSKMIQQISKATFQLLENLLSWSRLQIGTMPFQTVKLQLNDEVSSAIDMMMVQASRKSISIYNLVNADAIVLADTNMLQAILRNLISNAVKFTKPEGRIEIRSEPDKSFQVIRVSDNGVGIVKEVCDRLFRDADGIVSTYGTGNEKGHGLGLILCRYMIEKNGGAIWLESTSDEGSTFAFTLPGIQN